MVWWELRDRWCIVLENKLNDVLLCGWWLIILKIKLLISIVIDFVGKIILENIYLFLVLKFFVISCIVVWIGI